MSSTRRLRAVGDVVLLRLARRDLVLVEIAVGLGRELERQLVVGVLAVRLDVDVVQRADARQRRDAAHELAGRVTAAGEPALTGPPRVAVLLLPGLLREQLLV